MTRCPSPETPLALTLATFTAEPKNEATNTLSAACIRRVETFGRGFERYLRRCAGLEEEVANDSPSKAAARRKERDVGQEMMSGKKQKIRTKKLADDELEDDHYEVLGIGHLNFNATDDDIKEGYKKMILVHHPDKQRDGGGGDADAFKAVQKAFDVLSDKQKRRAFDSSLPFDDSIPPAKTPPEDFYEVFGKCFAENARWSIQPAPQLGDDSTPFSVVDEFYDFWLKFKTWRDFSHVDEHNPDDAEDRFERKWIIQQNERIRKASHLAEVKRIRTLVERAEKLDPRIKRQKELERQAKADAVAAKQKAKEDAEKAEKEAKEAVAVKAKAETEKIGNEQKLQKQIERNAKNFVKTFLAAFIVDEPLKKLQADKILFDDYYWLGLRLDEEKAYKPLRDELFALLGPDAADKPVHCPAELQDEAIAIFNGAVLRQERKKNIDRFGKPLKELQEGETLEIPVAKKTPDVWTEEELVELTKAIQKYPGGARERWKSISEYMGGKKTPEQVLKKTKELQNQLSVGTAPKKPKEIVQGDRKEQAGSDVPVTAVEEELWSKDQQTQLEVAIREFKDYKGKDKWDLIAAKVDGKEKKQCVDRFKFLANVLAKK